MTKLIHISECLSTNDEILKHIESPLEKEDLLALYTLRQRQGKGQYGNQWLSNDDENIAISFALDATSIPHSVSSINYHTAIITRDFIANLTDSPTKIKWPNDIILKNKKIGGILLERKAQYLIIGIGLNILQSHFPDLHRAGSVYTQTRLRLDPHTTAKNFFAFFKHRILQEHSTQNLLKDFNRHLYKRGEVAVFETPNGIRQNGIIQKADENGFLWILFEQNDFARKFYHKEVKMHF